MSEFRFFAITDFEFSYNRSQNLVNLPISPFHPTRRTTTDEISHELNVPYTVFEILVAICAIIGNLMVIVVFQRERKLRRRTNYYIISLAMADFLVGSLGVPFAILASVGLPTNLHACLFTVSLLVVLCTISIFCLVAVSVDRYWAILYPMAYSRNVRTRTAIVIISMCWLAGTVVGFLPLFGWHAAVDDNQACLFVEVMDYNYLVFLYFATIITPALLMLAFYAHIYKVIIKQVRQIVTMNPMADTSRRNSASAIHSSSISNSRSCQGGTMLRVLGAARKRDVKATQNLSIIVLFFMVCWIPLYTINCVQAFCPTCTIHPKITLFCIILSHLNSAVNPILYAYHLKDFRLALKNLILKIMGIDIETTLDAQYRYSMASQHRLQSMDVSARNNVQTRIYIDSPVWLRQQQQQQSFKAPHLLPKCGVVQPCLNNIHQTVAAVASVTNDIDKDMWNIMEVPSPTEVGETNYVFPDEKDTTAPTPPPRRRRKSRQKADDCDGPYSYENSTFTPSPEGDDFEEVFLPSRCQENNEGGGGAIDHKLLNQTLIACAMRDKLRSDVDDRPSSTSMSQSDYEIPKKDGDVNNSPYHLRSNSNKSPTNTPPLTPKQLAHLQQKENVRTSYPFANSNGCLSSNSIYIIDSDSNPVSPGRKPKFRNSATKSLTHYCSSSSDSTASPPLPQRELKETRQSCSNSSSSSSLSCSQPTSNHKPPVSAADRGEYQHSNSNGANYFTLHYPSALQEHQAQSRSRLQRQPYSPQEKFSPLKAVSNFLFPPIGKHSSLFQLFHPSSMTTETSSNTNGLAAAAAAASTATATISKSSIHFPTTDSDSISRCSNNAGICYYEANEESIVTAETDIVDDLTRTSSLEVPKVGRTASNDS